MGLTLDGVRQTWPHSTDLGDHVTRVLAERGQVAFHVLPEEPALRGVAKAETRLASRLRTRLRSAKILNARNEFLCECRIHDRSTSGARLVLARNLGLPGGFSLFDDETGEARPVAVVWRKATSLGVRYCGPRVPLPLKARDRFTLTGRYYAVPDR